MRAALSMERAIQNRRASASDRAATRIARSPRSEGSTKAVNSSPSPHATAVAGWTPPDLSRLAEEVGIRAPVTQIPGAALSVFEWRVRLVQQPLTQSSPIGGQRERGSLRANAPPQGEGGENPGSSGFSLCGSRLGRLQGWNDRAASSPGLIASLRRNARRWRARSRGCPRSRRERGDMVKRRNMVNMAKPIWFAGCSTI
jgi:hypothetical protein